MEDRRCVCASVDGLRVEMMGGLLVARVVAQPRDGGTRLLLQSGAAGLNPDAVFGTGERSGESPDAIGGARRFRPDIGGAVMLGHASARNRDETS